MENSPRLYTLIFERMHKKRSLPTKAVLQLKLVSEKQRFQANTNSLRNEDCLYLGSERFLEMGTLNRKEN